MASRKRSSTAPPPSFSPAGACAMPKWWRRQTVWASPWSSPASATSGTDRTVLAAPGRAFCPAWGAWMFRVGRRCPVVPIWELEPIPRPAFALACRFPPLEPSPKRLLRLTRSTTRQETLHADVFIQIWPVDPLATGNETPVGPLRRCPVRQAWEPRKWHRDRPAIRKFRDQSIVAHTYAMGQCFPEFSPRSTHAMTSTKSRFFRDHDRGHERQRESVHRPLTQRQCRGAGLSRVSSQGSCPLHQEPGE